MKIEDAVIDYYQHTTEALYIGRWSSDHIHFGLFEPEECPSFSASMVQRYSSCPDIKRAVQRMIDVVVNIESTCYYADREAFLREV